MDRPGILTRNLFASVMLILTLMTAVFAQQADDPALDRRGDVAEKLDLARAELELERQDIRRIDGLLETTEGYYGAVLSSRRDKLWITMFGDTVDFAKAVADRRDAGADVSAYLNDIASLLGQLPAEAVTALSRVRTRIEFPTVDLPPNQFVVTDQQLFRVVGEMDALFSALISYLNVADRFNIDASTERDDLIGFLADSAASRSMFLEKAVADVRSLRSATAALPDDAELKSWLSATEARVGLAAEALQNSVRLMNQLGIETRQYRQQLLTVTGEITSAILDVGILGSLISDWGASLYALLASQGPQLLLRVLLVVFIVFLFYQAGKLVRNGLERALNSPGNQMSQLLRQMIASSARNLILLTGFLFALSQLGISLGPLLAGLGIAGFIIGFALQDSLSNFASGIMILAYRPFDVGDMVNAAGTSGRVHAMSLVNTTFMTLDNQTIIVPNNAIWKSVITNLTAQKIRRIDLEFGISFGDDIEKAESALREVVSDHPSVLREPAPIIRLHEIGESSLNFVVRPWVKTEDYWDTYWDLMKAVKLRLDQEGISIPFPQRDIHVIGNAPD